MKSNDSLVRQGMGLDMGDKIGDDLQLGGVPSYNKLPSKRSYVGIKARRKSISNQNMEGRMGGLDMEMHRGYDTMGNSADMNKYMMYYNNNLNYGDQMAPMHQQMEGQPHKMSRLNDHRDVTSAAASKAPGKHVTSGACVVYSHHRALLELYENAFLCYAVFVPN